jgi:hypothetical protein
MVQQGQRHDEGDDAGELDRGERRVGGLVLVLPVNLLLMRRAIAPPARLTTSWGRSIPGASPERLTIYYHKPYGHSGGIVTRAPGPGSSAEAPLTPAFASRRTRRGVRGRASRNTRRDGVVPRQCVRGWRSAYLHTGPGRRAGPRTWRTVTTRLERLEPPTEARADLDATEIRPSRGVGKCRSGPHRSTR